MSLQTGMATCPQMGRIAAPVCTPRALASRRGLARNDRLFRQSENSTLSGAVFLLYSLDRLAKHLTQQVCHTLRGLNGGDHQQVAIHLRPVEVMSRAANELRQERPLGTPVALAEGVQVVGGAVKSVISSTKASWGKPLK